MHMHTPSEQLQSFQVQTVIRSMVYGKSLTSESAMFRALYCMCKIYFMSMMSESVLVLFCTCQIYGTEGQIDTTRLQLMWGSLALTHIISKHHER